MFDTEEVKAALFPTRRMTRSRSRNEVGDQRPSLEVRISAGDEEVVSSPDAVRDTEDADAPSLKKLSTVALLVSAAGAAVPGVCFVLTSTACVSLPSWEPAVWGMV